MAYFTALVLLLALPPLAWSQEASKQLRQAQAQEQEALEGQYAARSAPLGQSYAKAYQNFLQKKGPYPQSELRKISELKASREKARTELTQKQDRERLDLREKMKSKATASAGSLLANGKKSSLSSTEESPIQPTQPAPSALDASSFPKMIEFKKKATP